jgi:hypothetical protein
MIAVTELVVIIIVIITTNITRNSMYVIQDLFRLYEYLSVYLRSGLPTFLLPIIKHQ